MAGRESLNRRSFIKHIARATIGGFGFLDACVTPYVGLCDRLYRKM